MPMHNLIEYSSNYFETTGLICGFIQKMKQLTLIIILKTLVILNDSSVRLSF